MTFNPYKNQIKFAQAVNVVIGKGTPFYICRTVDHKVERLNIRMMSIDVQTGDLKVLYTRIDGSDFAERASKIDLLLIDQQARQYEQKLAKGTV